MYEYPSSTTTQLSSWGDATGSATTRAAAVGAAAAVLSVGALTMDGLVTVFVGCTHASITHRTVENA